MDFTSCSCTAKKSRIYAVLKNLYICSIGGEDYGRFWKIQRLFIRQL